MQNLPEGALAGGVALGQQPAAAAASAAAARRRSISVRVDDLGSGRVQAGDGKRPSPVRVTRMFGGGMQVGKEVLAALGGGIPVHR